MIQLLSGFYHWIGRTLLTLVAIVLVLLAGSWIRDQLPDARQMAAQLAILTDAERGITAQREELERRIALEAGQLRNATVEQLDKKIAEIDGGILQREKLAEQASLMSAVASGKQAIAEHLVLKTRRAMEIELLRQEKDYLMILRRYADASASSRTGAQRLEQLRQAHIKAYADLSANLREQVELKNDAGFSRLLPLGKYVREVGALKAEERRLRKINEQAHQDYVRQENINKLLPSVSAPNAFRINAERVNATIEPLREQVAKLQEQADRNITWKVISAVQPVLPTALGIVAMLWVVPLAIRALFYFVLAPLAARRPPVVIDAKAGGAIHPSATFASKPDQKNISSISKTLELKPGDELLIHPDYCQSLPTGVSTNTKLLFDWRYPIASIAAHLWMLKRVHTRQPTDIVISATRDPLDEVAVLDIPAGCAFVLQPRALVGVICRESTGAVIKRHWRLGTLHAWLTLQLRYLSFQGPVTLIVKGCRGVRLEPAGSGRSISQSATLGFSANTLYSTTRAEPFIPYASGTQALLQDAFAGEHAFYLYEEVPRATAEGRKTRNPIEGLLDAGLKAFGI
jgi:hypothetical protein